MIVAFTANAWNDYLHWQEGDRRTVLRINALIEDTRRSPFEGIGKPEPLRGDLAGSWSKRITGEHRLVYRVVGSGDGQHVQMIACRYHY